MRSFLIAALTLMPLPGFAELPDLGGREVVVVTENAYPPLQFVAPGTRRGDRLGIRRHGRDRRAAELRR